MEKKSADDFKFGRVIGEGSFSTVYLAKEVTSGNEYASESLLVTDREPRLMINLFSEQSKCATSPQ